MSGWVTTGSSAVWRPDVDTARAQFMTEYDAFFGEEYERLSELLSDLVAAVKRESAEEIRTQFGEADGAPTPCPSGYVNPVRVANFIDPDKGQE